ncbi:choline transporter-like protein 2 [Gigantopelta aegis]|uniref:choline transporter-like protein 2 n=1 Tax=Gigantopelta aegis TaxID=1735272 RepID=UPI001B889A07|nr:choline transporter-like protein 2 [Gigantopelta aegis]
MVVAYFGFMYGNPKLLLSPADSNGRVCGVGDQKNKSFLMYLDVVMCGRTRANIFFTKCPSPQVCVKKCPQKHYVYTQDLVSQNKDNLICKHGTNMSKTVQKLVHDGDCAAYYFISQSIMRRCFPAKKLLGPIQGDSIVVQTDSGPRTVESSSENISSQSFLAAMHNLRYFIKVSEYGEKITADVIATWWIILTVLVLCSLVSMLWIFLMRWLAGLMTWLMIIACLAIFGVSSGYSFYLYTKTRGSGSFYTIYLPMLTWNIEKDKLFLGIGITAGIIFVIVLLIVLVLCQRIRLAVQLLKEASKAVGSMKFSLMWPFLPFILQLGFIAFWLVLTVYLATVSAVKKENEHVALSNGSVNLKAEKLFDMACAYGQNEGDNVCSAIVDYGVQYATALQVYNLALAIWLVNFVVAFGQMTLAGTFGLYYWAPSKPKILPAFPVLLSFGRTVRYHLGTVAFGSFIITLVKLIRLLLEYLDGRLKGTENAVAQFILKCMKCCFWCLEKFLKFINKNAYIMCAIYGKNFCASAKKAFFLIMRNVVRVVVVDNVADFLLFLAKLVIVAAAGVASYFFFEGRIPFLKNYVPSLHFYFVPTVIVILGSYVVASCFFSVYEMAVKTLFLCFLQDLEINDGSPERPHFMSKNLMKILGKKNLRDVQAPLTAL